MTEPREIVYVRRWEVSAPGDEYPHERFVSEQAAADEVFARLQDPKVSSLTVFRFDTPKDAA